MFIQRYYKNLSKYLKKGNVLVVYGPRRVGKTTLIQNFISKFSGKVYAGSGDNATLQDVLESQDFARIIPFFEDYDLIFIDEAQKIESIGLALKIIVDQLPNTKVIATGSSSFNLSNKVGEPLVGRQTVLKLFPIAAIELKKEYGAAYLEEQLENLLLFGSYPDVITERSTQNRIEYLYTLRDSYLYRDILELENIRNSKKLLDLLRLVAFQIGQEVSLQELGSQLNMSKNTVERYLDLLEKAFVLINVRGFSRNLRKEITKTSRYYFYDTGVRNAVIGNFNLLNSRNDIGQLWENFLFIERLKKKKYKKIHTNNYFWRTWDQKEIDLVEERNGNLYGYEFKWGAKNPKRPNDWKESYPDASFSGINRQNFMKFIT